MEYTFDLTVRKEGMSPEATNQTVRTNPSWHLLCLALPPLRHSHGVLGLE